MRTLIGINNILVGALNHLVNDNVRKVILITIDCLRFDHISYSDCSNVCTPNIDKIVHNGVCFSNAFANSAATPGSFPAIFFSKYAWEAYNRKNGTIRVMPSIQGTLRRNGYKTASIHSNPFISRLFKYDRDFSFFYDDIHSEAKFNISKLDMYWRKLSNLYRRYVHFKGSVATASEINNIAKTWLTKNLKQKYFLHLHYMDVHYPYFPKEKFFKKNFGQNLNIKNRLKALSLFNRLQNSPKVDTFSKENIKLILTLYKSCIETVDEEIGKILEFLRERDQMEQTLFILTADHGQELGERGYHVHGRLYDETIHVPLIILYPELVPKKIYTQIRLIDIPPTIHEFLGIDIPKSYRGKSLCKLVKNQNNESDRVVISCNDAPKLKEPNRFLSIRVRPWKLILKVDKMGRVKNKELYNVESDPGENENVAHLYERVTATLEKDLIENYLENFMKWRSPNSWPDI